MRRAAIAKLWKRKLVNAFSTAAIALAGSMTVAAPQSGPVATDCKDDIPKYCAGRRDARCGGLTKALGSHPKLKAQRNLTRCKIAEGGERLVRDADGVVGQIDRDSDYSKCYFFLALAA